VSRRTSITPQAGPSVQKVQASKDDVTDVNNPVPAELISNKNLLCGAAQGFPARRRITEPQISSALLLLPIQNDAYRVGTGHNDRRIVINDK
jgi:hypothetical protein